MPNLYRCGGGNLVIKRALATATFANGGATINISALLPNIYKKLTMENFFVNSSDAEWHFGGTSSTGSEMSVRTVISGYNAATGVVSLSTSGYNRNSAYWTNKSGGGGTAVVGVAYLG